MLIKSFDKIIIDGFWFDWPDLEPVPNYEVRYINKTMSITTFVGYVKNKKYWFWIKVFPGFICDGQSSPRLVWGITRPDGPVRIAAFLHDACYRTGGFTRKNNHCFITANTEPLAKFGFRVKLSRLACDQIYRDVFIQTGGKIFKNRALLGYFSLRLFGQKYFGQSAPNINI